MKIFCLLKTLIDKSESQYCIGTEMHVRKLCCVLWCFKVYQEYLILHSSVASFFTGVSSEDTNNADS